MLEGDSFLISNYTAVFSWMLLEAAFDIEYVCAAYYIHFFQPLLTTLFAGL